MSKAPSTNATRLLKQAGIPFAEHLYRYEAPLQSDEGGLGASRVGGSRSRVKYSATELSARELGLAEHMVIKTLVMEDEKGAPLIVLMHGDREVSTKELARQIGAKAVQPCRPEVANRHSGYLVGGTSPLGTKKAMPIHAEATIFELPRICLNGGSRGFLVELDPRDLERVLKVHRVSVAIP
jgi:Cys-tRNA(Pro) deacylase